MRKKQKKLKKKLRKKPPRMIDGGEIYLPNLILIAGPTGSGKTALATSLDPSLFEVVSFDSRQIYKDLPIGTTSPTEQERNLMPHSMVQFVDSQQTLDAKKYAELALIEYQKIQAKSKIPILIAGTGFYLKAFLYGMYPIPDVPEKIHNEILALSNESVVSELQRLDPSAYMQISKNDFYRYRRALEVCWVAGSWSQFKQETKGGLLKSHPELRIIGYFLDWDREILYQRINKRAYSILLPMAEECKKVQELYGRDCPGLKTLGYNFALDYVDQNLSLDSFYEEIAKDHRNYAKRQITWFKKEPLLQSVSWDFALERLLEFQLLIKKNKNKME
jgi:tRNA dimethylallyltransferase